MEKSSKPINQKAYIRYLRKVTGEQVDTGRIHKEVMVQIFKAAGK